MVALTMRVNYRLDPQSRQICRTHSGADSAPRRNPELVSKDSGGCGFAAFALLGKSV